MDVELNKSRDQGMFSLVKALTLQETLIAVVLLKTSHEEPTDTKCLDVMCAAHSGA